MDFGRLFWALALVLLVPGSVLAGDIVHDDDDIPKQPGCSNEFVLVSTVLGSFLMWPGLLEDVGWSRVEHRRLSDFSSFFLELGWLQVRRFSLCSFFSFFFWLDNLSDCLESSTFGLFKWNEFCVGKS